MTHKHLLVIALVSDALSENETFGLSRHRIRPDNHELQCAPRQFDPPQGLYPHTHKTTMFLALIQTLW